MPTASSVLTQRRFFGGFFRTTAGQTSANRVKKGVFRFYYRNMPFNMAQPAAARGLDDLNGARGASARVADAFAAPNAGGADVVWAMVPTACGKWRHVVNTKIIRAPLKQKETTEAQLQQKEKAQLQQKETDLKCRSSWPR